MKRLIALRKRYPAFGRGTLEFLHPENRKVLAFMRQLRGRDASSSSPTCRASCSTSSSTCRAFQRHACRSSCSASTQFPPIGELPYLLTLGPHAFYWFALRAGARAGRRRTAAGRGPTLRVGRELDDVVEPPRGRAALERALPALPAAARRWFARQGAAHPRRLRIARRHAAADRRAAHGPPPACSLLVDVEYTEGEPETYVAAARALDARASAAERAARDRRAA